jgi:hypothetical protein
VGALTYNGGAGDDTLNLDGATLAVGSVLDVGDSQDTLILNADSVVTTIRTSATNSNNAFRIQDDASTANTSGFTSGSDKFDYNGSLAHDSVTSVVVAAGATLQAAVTADSDATVYLIQDANGDNDLEVALSSFAANVSVSIGRANALETTAAGPSGTPNALLSYSGLDLAFDSTDFILLAIDSETNEDGTTPDNGGTALYRFNNNNTSTVDTVLSSELELIGVFQDTALIAADFM